MSLPEDVVVVLVVSNLLSDDHLRKLTNNRKLIAKIAVKGLKVVRQQNRGRAGFIGYDVAGVNNIELS